MKFLRIIAIVSCITLSNCAVTEEEKEIATGMLGSCKDSEGASDDDVSELVNGNVKDNPESKCLMSCALNQFGFVSYIEYQ